MGVDKGLKLKLQFHILQSSSGMTSQLSHTVVTAAKVSQVYL